VAIVLVLALAFGVSLWTSVWQARARDLRFALGYALGFWYLLTPIVYPASHLPALARAVAAYNPMTGPVEAFKWSVLGIGTFPGHDLVVSAGVTAAVLAAGLWYFARAEGHVVDRL
jgi:lipopolysaccharide transport system permease protein